MATLKVQCRGCDHARRACDDDDEWVTVQEDFNQSFLYCAGGRDRRREPAAGR